MINPRGKGRRKPLTNYKIGQRVILGIGSPMTGFGKPGTIIRREKRTPQLKYSKDYTYTVRWDDGTTSSHYGDIVIPMESPLGRIAIGVTAMTRPNPHWLKEYAKKHGGTYTRKVEPSGLIIHTLKLSKRAMNPLLETVGSGIVTGLGLGTGFAISHRVADKVLGKRRNPAKPHTEVTVSKLPKCDFCSATALYDGKTRMGPWAYMCPMHFRMYGYGLGLGRGQKLILRR